MTKEEQNVELRRRFIFVYSRNKMLYLRDQGFRYLFKSYNGKTHSVFYVFDRTPEINQALSEYLEKI